MHRYITRRVLLLIPSFIIVTTIIFILIRLMPGTILDIKMGRIQAVSAGAVEISPEQMQQLLEELGLDAPIYVQYVRWLGDLFRGDFGYSLARDFPVSEMLSKKIPVTLELGLLAILIAVILAVPIGIYSSMRQDSIGDYVGRSLAILFISLPAFWIAVLVVVFASVWWGWSSPLPYPFFLEKPLENLAFIWIPAVVVGLVIQGWIMRTLRTTMLEVMKQDYVRTAWAKGLGERTVIFRHVVRNGLIPVVTMIGLQTPYLIGGMIVIEKIFMVPGVGNMLVSGIFERDYTVISAASLFFTFCVLISNLVTDLSYAFLDPRVRYK